MQWHSPPARASTRLETATPTMAKPIQQCLREAIEFISCSRACGVQDASALERQCVQDFRAACASAPGLALQEASAMLRLVSNAGADLGEAVRESLGQEIVALTQKALDPQAADGVHLADRRCHSLQRHLHMQNYLTESDWRCLRDPQKDTALKMRSIIARSAMACRGAPGEEGADITLVVRDCR